MRPWIEELASLVRGDFQTLLSAEQQMQTNIEKSRLGNIESQFKVQIRKTVTDTFADVKLRGPDIAHQFEMLHGPRGLEPFGIPRDEDAAAMAVRAAMAFGTAIPRVAPGP